MQSPDDITPALEEAIEGPSGGAEQLLPRVYDELKAYVRRQLWPAEQRLVSPTEIVHEVYLRLAAQERAGYSSREHFFAIAARAVRRVLVDQARMRQASKRGGGRCLTSVDSRILDDSKDPIDLLDLNAALDALQEEDPRCAELVELRFFAGLSIPSAAERLGLSTATAERDWRFARAFLREELGYARPSDRPG